MDPFDLNGWEDFSLAGGQEAQSPIIDQIAIDSRRIDSKHSLFVALKGEKDDGHRYIDQAARAGAKFALVSQDYFPSKLSETITLLRVPNTLKAFQQISKDYRMHLKTKIIGIAGSFGKTMVKDLLHAFLSVEKYAAASPESFNSQIGVPLSLLTLTSRHELAVIEAAFSQPNEMGILADLIRPDFTVVTPIGKKHLATLKDMPTVMEEMMKFIQGTSTQGWVLLPNCFVQNSISFPAYFWDEWTKSLPHASPFQGNSTSSKYQITFPDGTLFQGKVYSGHAYFLNLLNMTIKGAWLSGISSSSIISILNQYRAEPTRTEIWKSPVGAIFINDTYCSDPQSIDQSLRHLELAPPENRKFFVFGGMRGNPIASQTDYRRIGKALAKSSLTHLIVVGSKPFKPLIDEIKTQQKVLAFDDYSEAFSFLQQHIKNNDLIIFKGENKLPLEILTETFNDSLSNNQCFINLAAIHANLSIIRKKLPEKTRIMVMVKALAYGTDDVRMAKFLANCGIDILGVSYVDEGVGLKRAGVKQSIFSINAAPYEAAKVVKWDIEVGVSSDLLIDALEKEASASQKKVKVHLHVNTGMGRFGCRPEEAYLLAKKIHASLSLELEGIMSHFACSDDPNEDAFSKKQILILDEVIQNLADRGIRPKWSHAANSSGAIRFHLPQYNMVRLGLAVYGLYVSETAREALDLHLAISLNSRIVGMNICTMGETISYGRSYCVTRETQKIAVLPIGYFDGLHRHYSGKAHVMVNGQRAPMVGNICMDNMMVDVTDIPEVEVGDKVLIFGEDEFGYYLSPEDLAKSGNSIVHELITCLGPRIPRIFIYEEGKQIR